MHKRLTVASLYEGHLQHIKRLPEWPPHWPFERWLPFRQVERLEVAPIDEPSPGCVEELKHVISRKFGAQPPQRPFQSTQRKRQCRPGGHLCHTVRDVHLKEHHLFLC